jgi:plasmid stability protein
VKNITLSIDDETYRQARIRAAEQNTSVSALVKQFLTARTQAVHAGAPPAALLELAAELRALTAGRKHTPAEVLQREGRDERTGVGSAAWAALLARLQSEPVVEAGRWSRDELYEDQR